MSGNQRRGAFQLGQQVQEAMQPASTESPRCANSHPCDRGCYEPSLSSHETAGSTTKARGTIRHVTGDASTPQFGNPHCWVIIHTSDDSGMWPHNLGFFGTLESRYPDAMLPEYYATAKAGGNLLPGSCHFIPLTEDAIQWREKTIETKIPPQPLPSASSVRMGFLALCVTESMHNLKTSKSSREPRKSQTHGIPPHPHFDFEQFSAAIASLAMEVSKWPVTPTIHITRIPDRLSANPSRRILYWSLMQNIFYRYLLDPLGLDLYVYYFKSTARRQRETPHPEANSSPAAIEYSPKCRNEASSDYNDGDTVIPDDEIGDCTNGSLPQRRRARRSGGELFDSVKREPDDDVLNTPVVESHTARNPQQKLPTLQEAWDALGAQINEGEHNDHEG